MTTGEIFNNADYVLAFPRVRDDLAYRGFTQVKKMEKKKFSTTRIVLSFPCVRDDLAYQEFFQVKGM